MRQALAAFGRPLACPLAADQSRSRREFCEVTPPEPKSEGAHPLEERPLTIREYARIQTFGDDYTFTGSVASQYKQIGNAVPVELARQMGVSLINALL